MWSTLPLGRTGAMVDAASDAGGGDVLELQGDNVHVFREALHSFHVVIGSHDFAVGDVTGGRVGFR